MIMKKRIEKYFQPAMAAIQEELQKGKSEIPREYQAYAAAFGSSILQMGLLPTLAVHADAESGSAEDKGLLLKVLAKTLATSGSLSKAAHEKLEANKFDLYRTVVFNREALEREFREHLLDAIVAVKLCLRTFNLTKL